MIARGVDPSVRDVPVGSIWNSEAKGGEAMLLAGPLPIEHRSAEPRQGLLETFSQGNLRLPVKNLGCSRSVGPPHIRIIDRAGQKLDAGLVAHHFLDEFG
jgi:hypothetical protein